jgi:alanine racemase/LacI family transcriptional regulator
VELAPLTLESGVAAMERLLASSTRPTAVFASNREMTVGALTALGDSGLRIPADLSLIGFDIVELARVVQPQLTIVVQPTDAIAAEAAALIRRRLDGAAEPFSTHTLASRLVDGASVAHLHHP